MTDVPLRWGRTALATYACLRQHGPQLACNLARRAYLKRSAAQTALSRLAKDGFVKRERGLWALTDKPFNGATP